MPRVWIDSVTVRDFGPFYGEHTFNLTPLEGRSGILIGGKNGAGKTHLLRALYLAVVGETGVGDLKRVETGSDATRFSFDRVLNRMAYSEGRDTVGLSATVSLRDDDSGGSRKVKFHREVRFRPNSAAVWKSTAERSDTDGVIIEDEQVIQRLRDSVLPRHLARFFFFDAERSQSISLGQQDIVEGISRILGLWTYSELENDLRQLVNNKIPRVFSRSSGDDPQSKLIDVSAEVSRLDGHLSNRRRELEVLDREIREFEAELLEIEDDLKTLGAVDPEELARVQDRRNQLAPNREKMIENLTRAWEFSLPIALLGQFKVELDEYLQSEERRREWEAARSAVEPKIPQVKADVFESAPPEFKLENDIQGFYLARLETALSRLFNPPPDGMAERVYVVDRNDTSFKLRNQLVSPLPYIGELSSMVQDIERTDIEIRELDQRLKQMQQSAAANRRGLELHEKRGQVQTDLQQRRVKRIEVEAEIPRLERDLQEKRREETNLTETVQRAVKGESLATLASKYREAAGVIRAQAATDLRGSISEMVGDLWIEIAGQGREFSGIEFDSHWQCWLRKRDGSKISWDEANTSAGQRQVRMLAFYEALRQLARLVPPLVVDTPLARLDKQVRMSVLERLYLSGHQSVILTTDSEIDPEGNSFEAIESKLARVYTLSPIGDPSARDYQVNVSSSYFGREI